MNNFKKLLASAMALTMVASVMPAVSTNVDAALKPSICKAETFAPVQPVLNWVLDPELTMDDLGSVEFATYKITWDDGQEYSLKDIFTTANEEGAEVRLTALKNAVTCADENELEKVQYLYNVASLYVNYLYGHFVIKEIDNPNFAEYTEAVEHLASLETLYYDYNGNLSNDEREAIYAAIVDGNDYIESLDYDSTDVLKTYVSNLKTTIEQFVENETKNDTSLLRKSITKTELTNFIKNIENDRATYKDDKNATVTLTGYKAFKDEEPVVEIMDELDSWFEEIETVEDAVSTKNDIYKTMSEVVENSVVKNSKGELVHLYRGDAIVDNLTMEDWEVYKEFKEEVIDVIYTMETEKFASKYYDASSKSYFVTNQELWSALSTFSGEKVNKDTNAGFLATVYNTSTGVFGWDVLETHMEAVIEAYELIDVELDKLVAKNLTVNDKDMILALDDAYDYLTNEGKDNLTSAEAKEVRRAERTIDELYEAYRVKFGSLAETTGWVDMGNGDWKYFEADGTAPTKWICTAPNTWYYVQNGVMLRNAWVWRDATSAYYVGDDGKMLYGPATTPDGYVIDANGLWHA